VARPRRCTVQIHAGRLPRAEAVAWLGSEVGIGAVGATLAEPFAELGQVTYLEAPKAVGRYL
jgi:hypothetical protein